VCVSDSNKREEDQASHAQDRRVAGVCVVLCVYGGGTCSSLVRCASGDSRKNASTSCSRNRWREPTTTAGGGVASSITDAR